MTKNEILTLKVNYQRGCEIVCQTIQKNRDKSAKAFYHAMQLTVDNLLPMKDIWEIEDNVMNNCNISEKLFNEIVKGPIELGSKQLKVVMRRD